MTDADTLERAAEYLDAMASMYPQSPRRTDLLGIAARLREMAAARKRIAEPEWDIDLASIEELRFCAHVQRGSIDRLQARIAELEPLQEVVAQLEDEKRVMRELLQKWRGDWKSAGELHELQQATDAVLKENT